MVDNRRKILILTLLLSLFLHAVIILLLLLGSIFLPSSTRPDEKKITVKFSKPLPPPAQEPAVQVPPRIPDQFFELVDNPNANQKNPDQASMISDQASVAAAPEADVQTAIAHSAPEEKPDPSQSKDKQEAELKPDFSTFIQKNRGIFRKEVVGKELSGEDGNEEIGRINPSDESNKMFDPREIGQMALSTYAWEWAPYMKSWLRFLQQHWYAPPAYTELGLIQGQTIVRFRIYPDGHMEGLEVLYHEGHISLKESSINAVNASFPFKPLPENFPDPYLEITLRMMYPSLRRIAR